MEYSSAARRRRDAYRFVAQSPHAHFLFFVRPELRAPAMLSAAAANKRVVGEADVEVAAAHGTEARVGIVAQSGVVSSLASPSAAADVPGQADISSPPPSSILLNSPVLDAPLRSAAAGSNLSVVRGQLPFP